jgi:FAD/FMN-containing dehydrogenase
MARITWRNWAGNQTSAARVVEPSDLARLKRVVRSTAEKGRRMRASGGRYSWSELVPVPEGDTIISTKKLRRLIEIDKPNLTMTVESGMTIEELTRIAASKGLTLFSPTLFPSPTIGGVISTGGHGTDIHTGNFSDHICALTIITPDGTERTVREGDKGFHAAQVALGALGIVYSVKLKVEPQFSVYVDERRVPVRYVLDEFDDLIHSYDFVEMFWYPLQDHIWLYLMYRTNSEADQIPLVDRALSKLRDGIEVATGDLALPYLARYSPRLTPMLSWFADSLSQQVHQSVLPASEAFHFQKAYVKSWDISYAVPVNESRRAWEEVINLITEYARADVYPVNLAVHCRFIGKSQAWLAPNYGRESCCIEAATALDTQNWREFFDELEERWLAIDGARPHWGKVYDRPRELAARYPKMKDFLKVRESWDPDRVFLNDFLENEIFQLP